MLLRRVMQHVKDQNWFAVALDFVIVVVGILIAFQIAQWNDARKTREREAYVITQLASDIRAIHEQAQQYVEMYRGKVASADRIMAFITSGLESPEDEALLLGDFSNVMLRQPPIGRPPTWIELASAGDTGVIRNDELRQALTRFDLQVQATMRSDEVIVDFWFRYGENLGRKIILDDRLGDHSDGARYSTAEFDLSAMKSDPEFLSSMSWIKRMHVISADMYGATLTSSGKLAERLEAAQ